ncbi:MAG: FAD-binding protein [Nitrospirae bacterium]|nr:FAD-binding protein [Nitrospirota bacterium]
MNNLSDLLPGKVSIAQEDLTCYGFDASGRAEHPVAVVWAEDVPDVVKVMQFAHENDIAVIPRGAGSGMTGGAVPSRGSIVLSTERMNRILEINREDLTVLVEPGVVNGKLQRELERHGLFYPPDPSSLNFCTIGGNVAENAGGARALKYGVTRDYVMGLEAVLSDGRIITTGVKTAKGVVGYDLTRLLVGSEGTLAMITKIRLKVLPIPEAVITLLALFHEIEPAGQSVQRIISEGIVPRTLEFLDAGTIHAVENYKTIGLPGGTEAMLLIELDGAPSVITRDAERISAICKKIGGEIIMAENEIARMKLWEARRAISPALFHLSPTKINEDIVVPRSKLAEMLGKLKTLSESTGIRIVNFGHAGDGNIHVNLMVNRNNRKEYAKAQELVGEIFRITLELGGTISGEHGIGLTKQNYISMEIHPAELELMKKIKQAFDPKNLLNPGKIFP